MIGKAIGEKREDLASEYAKKFIRLSLIFGAIGGAVILLVRPLVIAGLHFEGTTASYMNTFMFMT